MRLSQMRTRPSQSCTRASQEDLRDWRRCKWLFISVLGVSLWRCWGLGEEKWILRMFLWVLKKGRDERFLDVLV